MSRLNKDNVTRAREVIALYPKPRSAVLPLLHIAQEQDGWLQDDAIEHVAELVGATPAEVLDAASFYTMFKRHPTGRYLISVCTNIACMLRGAYEVLEHAEGKLGIKAGGMTDDGTFSLEEAECLADCDRAPCLQVNYRYIGHVGPDSFDELVDDLKAGRLSSTIPPHGTLSRVKRSVASEQGER